MGQRSMGSKYLWRSASQFMEGSSDSSVLAYQGRLYGQLKIPPLSHLDQIHQFLRPCPYLISEESPRFYATQLSVLFQIKQRNYQKNTVSPTNFFVVVHSSLFEFLTSGSKFHNRGRVNCWEFACGYFFRCWKWNWGNSCFLFCVERFFCSGEWVCWWVNC